MPEKPKTSGWGIRWTPLLLLSCGAPEASQPGQGAPAMPVQIETVQAVPYRNSSELVALLRSRRSVQIQPLVEGHVTRIFVSSGDRVAAGAPLLEIDPARQRAVVGTQRAQQEANVAGLQYWRTQRDRVHRLFVRGAATRQDMDQTELALRQAEASAAASEAQVRAGTVELHYFQVKAPTAGTVGDIPVRVGDFVSPQTLLTTLDDNDVLETYVDVPADRAVGLQLGAPLEILDSDGKLLGDSKVTFVSPRTDPNTQLVLVKAQIDNRSGRLRSSQFVRVRMIWGQQTGPTVPVLAVQSRAGQSFVWVARPGPGGALEAQQRPVQVGAIVGQRYPVLKGVSPGERVVVSGVQKLRPGAPLAPAAASGAGGQAGG